MLLDRWLKTKAAAEEILHTGRERPIRSLVYDHERIWNRHHLGRETLTTLAALPIDAHCGNAP